MDITQEVSVNVLKIICWEVGNDSKVHEHKGGTRKSIISTTFSVLYGVSQEEWTKLRESVPYVKLYRYNPKHLYPKLNGYGDNGQRKVWTSCISACSTSTAV